jgi:hypothetical protein
MASGNDMKAASQTYSGFLTLMKVGTIASVITVAFVVFLLA